MLVGIIQFLLVNNRLDFSFKIFPGISEQDSLSKSVLIHFKVFLTRQKTDGTITLNLLIFNSEYYIIIRI